MPLPDPDRDDELDMLADQARAKARFCLATGVQPSEYEQLTIAERRAFIEQHERNTRSAK